MRRRGRGAPALPGTSRSTSSSHTTGKTAGRPLPGVGGGRCSRRGRAGPALHKIRLVPFGSTSRCSRLLTLGGRSRPSRPAGGRLHAGREYSVGKWTGTGSPRSSATSIFRTYPAVHVRGAELLVNITNDAWYGYTRPPISTRDGRLPRGREREVPGAGGEHRHQRGGGPARANRGAHRAVRPATLVRDVAFVPGTAFYAATGRVRLGLPGRRRRRHRGHVPPPPLALPFNAEAAENAQRPQNKRKKRQEQQLEPSAIHSRGASGVQVGAPLAPICSRRPSR